jgi:hypothetical protein
MGVGFGGIEQAVTISASNDRPVRTNEYDVLYIYTSNDCPRVSLKVSLKLLPYQALSTRKLGRMDESSGHAVHIIDVGNVAVNGANAIEANHD